MISLCVEYTIVCCCDGCSCTLNDKDHNNHQQYLKFDDINNLRKYFKFLGWYYDLKSKKHYCPYCYKKRYKI